MRVVLNRLLPCGSRHQHSLCGELCTSKRGILGAQRGQDRYSLTAVVDRCLANLDMEHADVTAWSITIIFKRARGGQDRMNVCSFVFKVGKSRRLALRRDCGLAQLHTEIGKASSLDPVGSFKRTHGPDGNESRPSLDFPCVATCFCGTTLSFGGAAQTRAPDLSPSH